ncbi:MAG: amidohydrolase family protein [Clostridia bacterium]|nr:amidohydrolase family protein [Clostridia bacterium]
MSKFSAKLTPAGFSFNLVADNNEIIATSQVYASKAGCLKGIESVQTNAPFAPVEDQTVANFERLENPKFEVFTDKADKFRFRLKAANGEIIAASQGYKEKAYCFKGIESVRANAPWAEVTAEDIFAERVIYGKFYTVDKKQPRAEAAAIVGGHFIYVGDAKGVKELIGKNTKVERYEDGLIIPGMAEGHCHCSVGGTMELFEANLLRILDVEEYRAKMKALIEKHPEFEVYQGFGCVHLAELYGPYGPTADMLDGLSDKPIVISDMGLHSYWVNHAAMERLGINKDTPDVSDGIVVRYEDGTPTGWFREGAMAYIKPLVVFSVEQYKEGFLRYQEEYLAHGMTMFMEAIINWDYTDNEVEALHQLDAEGKLKMHAFGAYQVFQAEGHDTIAEVEHAAALRARTKGPMFDLSNTKVQLDGTISPTHGTAYMKEPYCDPESQKSGNHGKLRMDMDTLTAVYQRSHELGMTVHLHAIGDGALAMALDAMEKANAKTGPHGFRDAIAHLEVVDRADIPRMAKLGVVASTDPYWIPLPPEFHSIQSYGLGKERVDAMHPIKSFFDAGVVMASASDYPITYPAYALIGIQMGVTRTMPGRPDSLHCPSERVTVDQMIQACTLNAAYQFLCDDRLGSISVGKEADLVVLEKDITACDPEQIDSTPVLRTMVGGEWVYVRA